MNQLPKIGEKLTDPPPTVFELVVSDHIESIDQTKYGLKGLEVIEPHSYFVTSGDAVEKAKVLDRDLWRLAGTVRKKLYAEIAVLRKCDAVAAQALVRSKDIPESLLQLAEYETVVWRAAGQARRMLQALIAAKGSNIFLETEWTPGHCLICVCKNPRR